MADWFREFLRNHPPKKMNGTNHLAPLKVFMKYMKKALRNHRPEGSSGIQKGDWRLPCGLKSSKAWVFFEKLFAQLRVHMMPAVKDVAPKQSSRKGRFQIVPTEVKPPVDVAHRRRRQPSSAALELVNGQWVKVISPESFLRRPTMDGPVVKGSVARRDKRGPTKPNACRL